MIRVQLPLTDREVEYLEKLIVKLHYDKRVDLYSLCSKHNPDAYARSQKKQKIPESIRWSVWRRDGFMCLYCFSRTASLTLDHVLAEEHGGTFAESNLVTACGKCNNRKGSMSVEDFLKEPWLIKKRAQNSQDLSSMEIQTAAESLKAIIESQATGIAIGLRA